MKNREFTLKPAHVQDSGYSWRMTVRTRPVAALLAAFMLLGLSACGGGTDNKTAPAAATAPAASPATSPATTGPGANPGAGAATAAPPPPAVGVVTVTSGDVGLLT